jgi:hypothetical protein
MNRMSALRIKEILRRFIIKNSAISYRNGAILVGPTEPLDPSKPSALTVALRKRALTVDGSKD